MSHTPEKCPPTNQSPKSSPTKKEIDAATAALNHFAQGKRHLVVGDIPSAVNSLQEACRFLAEEYGETAPECGDAYYHYGQALLELARIENGVLGNALEGVILGEDAENSQVSNPENLSAEEQVALSHEVGKALEENYKDLQNNKEKLLVDKKEREDGIESSPSSSSTDKDSNTKKCEISEVKEKKVVVNQDPNMSVIEEEEESISDHTNDSGLGTEAEKSTKATELSQDSGHGEGNTEENVERKQKKEGSTEDEEEEEEDGDDDDGDDTEAGEGDDAEAGDGDDAEAKAGDGEESQEGKSQDEEGNKEENGSQGEGEGEKTEEDEEEVTNLQLSWEMLELAKVIFQKQEEANPEMSKKVAQVYLKLGEVGLESENYAQGIEDFQQCLQIQERILEDDDRCLAETHYQLGVAHSFSDDFDKAIQSFKAAIKVIEQRIENLLKKIKEKESWTEEQRTKDAAVRPDPFYTEQGEIDELNQLLPEIKDKITDMEQMKNDSREKIQRAHKEALKAQAIAGKMGGSSAFGESSTTVGFDAPSSSSFGSAASAAKPITHLVRKKQRKAEDDVKEDQKKVRGENGEAVPVKSVTIKTDKQLESMVTKENSTMKESNAVKLKENGCTKTEEKD